MGCCSSDAAEHAKGSPCGCPQRFWHSERIVLGKAQTGDVFRHGFVEVRFKCDNCQTKFYNTYDLVDSSGGTKRKKVAFCYTTGYEVMESCNSRRSYEFVDDRYMEMTQNFSLTSRNCMDWSHEFYKKLR